MGRRKIEIKPLTDDRNRTITFTKRKAGLFKKAHELSILCEVDVSVIIIGRNHKIYEFSSDRTDDILGKYVENQQNVYERKNPKDFGQYEQKSRILEGLVKRQHGHSNSLSIPRNSNNQYSHSRSQSDVTQGKDNSAPRATKRQRSADHTEDNNDDDEDEDDDDIGDEEDDFSGNDTNTPRGMNRSSNEQYNDTTISLKPDFTKSTLLSSRKRKQDSKKSSISPNSVPEFHTPTEDIFDSKKQKTSNLIVPPETPDRQSDEKSRQASATVTPYYMRTKKKEGSNNTTTNTNTHKRPALSLKIPKVETDLENSNRQAFLSDTTITAAGSSNKSNQSNLAGLVSGKMDDTTQPIENAKTTYSKKDPVDMINAGDNTTTSDSNYTSGSSKNSNQQNTGAVLTQTQYGSNLNNSTPLPSALFRDKKNLYTPISSNFLGNMNLIAGNSVDTPANYFNFNGMSPTQLLTPMFPLIPSSNGNNNIGLHDVNTGSNAIGSNMRGETIQRSSLVQAQTQNNPNLNESQNTNHISEQGQNKTQNQLPHQLSQPFLAPMNSATSIYFPQMRMPNHRGSSSLHINTNYHSINSSEGGKNGINNTGGGNRINTGNLNTNVPSSGSITNIELPSLSGEISALPSRYVDFQSPNTIFASNDWQLPIGTTPIGGPPILPHALSGHNSVGNIFNPSKVPSTNNVIDATEIATPSTSKPSEETVPTPEVKKEPESATEIGDNLETS